MRTCILFGSVVASVLWATVLPGTAAPQDKGKKMQASITESVFGKMPDGTPVQQYVLTNANGMIAKIITYGGIITELHVPDKSATLQDVVHGFDNLDGYLAVHPFFGAIAG